MLPELHSVAGSGGKQPGYGQCHHSHAAICIRPCQRSSSITTCGNAMCHVVAMVRRVVFSGHLRNCY